MCNAWNHSPGCNCGWVGGSYGGSGSVSTGLSNRLANEIKDVETYPTTCWWCGEKVFYHTNGFGDSVLFDSLGSPWRVHSCWKNYWNIERILKPGKKHSNSVEDSLILRVLDGRRLILAGAIQSINRTQNLVTEKQVARYLGISLEMLRERYSHFYVHSWRLGDTDIIRMRK